MVGLFAKRNHVASLFRLKPCPQRLHVKPIFQRNYLTDISWFLFMEGQY